MGARLGGQTYRPPARGKTMPSHGLQRLVEFAFRQLNNGLSLDFWVESQLHEGRSWRWISEELTRRTNGLSTVTGQTLHTWYGPGDEQADEAAG